MIIEGFGQFGGLHPVTACLRKVLAHHGVCAPHTGEPFTEALLLGIGGGIGGLYFVFQSALGPILVIGGRHLSEGSKPTFFEGICNALDVPFERKETHSPAEADRHLEETLAEGLPAIVRLDLASLPYLALPPSLRRFFGHMVVVFGVDWEGGTVHLSDCSMRPLRVTTDELAGARRAIPSFKHKVLAVRPPARIPDLKPHVREGILRCCSGMLRPRTPGSGLAAWTKWAHLFSPSGTASGWRKVFRPGLPLYTGLVSVFEFVETWGTGGGAYRVLFAEFLEEAARILDRADLASSAERFHAIAEAWSDLARAALPDRFPVLRLTRERIVERARLFRDQGMEALERIREIAAELDHLREQMRELFPLDDAQSEGILTDLSERILAIRDREAEAFAELEARLTG